MEIDYNDLINMAGADGHSLQPFILTVGIDYALGDSYTSRSVWTTDNNNNPVMRGIENPYSKATSDYLASRGYLSHAGRNYPVRWPYYLF